MHMRTRALISTTAQNLGVWSPMSSMSRLCVRGGFLYTVAGKANRQRRTAAMDLSCGPRYLKLNDKLMSRGKIVLVECDSEADIDSISQRGYASCERVSSDTHCIVPVGIRSVFIL